MGRFQIRAAAQILLAMALTACMSSCGSSSSGTHRTHVSSSSATPSCETTPPNNVTIPAVSGDFAREAEYVVKCAGLKAATERRANLNVAEGIVITTAPAQGATVPTNSQLTIIISAGPNGCSSCGGIGGKIKVMPDVCGLTFQQAKTDLAENSITLENQTVSQASSEPRGKIIGSKPAAGVSFVAYGSQIIAGEVRTAKAVIVAISSGLAPSSARTASP